MPNLIQRFQAARKAYINPTGYYEINTTPFNPGGAQREQDANTTAAHFPQWEQVQRWPIAPPYEMAVTGYNKNELLYAAINKRASALAEAPLFVYSEDENGHSVIADDLPIKKLLKKPNPAMGEIEFKQACEIYLCIAGFAAWEVEQNNFGKPIGIWPMRPDYCSFRRGPNLPLEYVRYQYPGLPYVDIPIGRVLLFQEFNPIYPNLLGLSRTAIAQRILAVDNSATDFFANFFRNGAVTQGILKTAQSLVDVEADRARARWKSVHGGVGNWGDVAVLGSGLEYQSISMPLKDLDLSTVDGRTEARVCMIFETPAILLGAKIGIGASTYNNYSESRTAWYEETICPRWTWMASEMTQQLLPMYGIDPQESDIYIDYDLSEIKALQEDRTAKFDRADKAYNSGLVTLNEARDEMGMDPREEGDVIKGESANAVPEQLKPFSGTNPAPQEYQTTATEATPFEDTTSATPYSIESEKAIMREWRKSELAAQKAGTPRPEAPAVRNAPQISYALAGCKSAEEIRRVFENNWPAPRNESAAVLDELKRANALLEKALVND